MKANRGLRIPLVIAAAACLVFVASCAERKVEPAPAPLPTSRPLPRPLPPQPQPKLDWRDAPITPGDWRWSLEGGQSVARFAGGALVLRCDLTSRTVSLQRAGVAEGAVPMTVSTSYNSRQLSATPLAGPPPVLSVSFAARDPFLDAIAFSRGRFALETMGLPTLYVPSWPEISRVVEDCR
jgi:hypothetical protein